ncbi:MAG: helix-turn-helix domain-containing protein [Novosphingobium sp.]|jgi:excisionase family DNA binding protein|uniref:helix-turn-helix transcriptional regulator n=1 Tax=Novosphingobium sp. TaxID=1874826 RepID=UPI003017CB92
MHKLTVSIPEAANILSLSRSTIYELMDTGELTKVKFGRRTCITVQSLKNAVANRIGHDLSEEVFAA